MSKPSFNKNTERKVHLYIGEKTSNKETGISKKAIGYERLYKRRNGVIVTSKALQSDIAAEIKANAVLENLKQCGLF